MLFLDSFGEISIKDEFFQYCLLNPSYDEAIKKFGDKVLEAEIDGKIEIKNGRVFLL
jgi:DNA processing protein